MLFFGWAGRKTGFILVRGKLVEVTVEVTVEFPAVLVCEMMKSGTSRF